MFPFACFAWTIAVLLARGAIDQSCFHQDPGYGDDWYCQLDNGYMILMTDVTTYGEIRKIENQKAIGSARDQSPSIHLVSELQVAPRYILGRYGVPTPTTTERIGSASNAYFVLHLATNKMVAYPNLAALRAAAIEIGVKPKLAPIVEVYYQYRVPWFNQLAFVFLMIPPSLVFILISLWIWRIRPRWRNPPPTA